MPQNALQIALQNASGDTPEADLETRIAEAERLVMDTDAHFLRSTGELASALRGRAGRVVANTTLAGVALLGVVIVYRLASGHREKRHRELVSRGAPARAVPLRRSGAAGFLGETVGSAMRAAAAPRRAGLLSMLAATALPMLLRQYGNHRGNRVG